MTYKTIKVFGHDLGLSCAFRQWRAESHCRFLHGYALAVRLEFECDELDVRNWCVDYGSFKSLRGILEDNFDHKVIVAEDDPELPMFLQMETSNLCELITMERVGCEAFAEYIYEITEEWLRYSGYHPRVRIVSVQVNEHGANAASYARTTL